MNNRLVTVACVALTLLMCSAVAGQEFSYWFRGQQLPLVESDTLIAVKFSDGFLKQGPTDAFQTTTTVLADDFEGFDISPDFRVFRLEENTALAEATDTLMCLIEVEVVHSCFRSRHDLMLFLTNEITIKFAPEMSQACIDSILSANHLAVVRISSYRPRVYYVVMENATQPNEPLDLANDLYLESATEYCHPNFVGELVKDEYEPSDEFWSLQWYLANTGQLGGYPDADIDAEEAWETTMGDSDVIVMIIDDGIQYHSWEQHPDLGYARYCAGYDFAGYDRKYPIPDDDPTPCFEQTHGMCCTGLIAASYDNIEGITGVAPNVKFGSAKIYHDDDCSGIEKQAADRIAWAIEWSYIDVGAHVISCSWHFPETEDIADAILEAVFCNDIPFFFSSGNFSMDHPFFPASLEWVMSIGATDMWDQLWFYSNLGKTADMFGTVNHMVAPSGSDNAGGNFITLDGIGEPGYCPRIMNCNPEGDNNYACAFGGTSGACPLVAATAALVLSVRPDLRRQNVQELYNILLASAEDQVGGINDTPGFDLYYGYGRLNARAALDTAIAWEVFQCDCGDADGNGLFNISDAVYILAYIFGSGPEPSPYCRGDADGNCLVNISDAVYLIAYVFGGGPAPYCNPEPECYPSWPPQK